MISTTPKNVQDAFAKIQAMLDVLRQLPAELEQKYITSGTTKAPAYDAREDMVIWPGADFDDKETAWLVARKFVGAGPRLFPLNLRHVWEAKRDAEAMLAEGRKSGIQIKWGGIAPALVAGAVLFWFLTKKSPKKTKTRRKRRR